MAKSFQFRNQRSVRFRLHSFALPLATTLRKNYLYAQQVSGLKGTKAKLLPALPDLDHHGYDHIVRWGYWLFASDQTGLYYADQDALVFRLANAHVQPHQLAVSNNRLFLLALNRRRLVYSVNLSTEQWSSNPENLLTGNLHLPDDYGLCLDIMPYRNQLLVVCEHGMLVVTRNLQLKHFADDSELLQTPPTAVPTWQSAWFSLGYATDTQVLREVFLRTNVPLTLQVVSNRSQRTIRVSAGENVQKIKINLSGDQFQITLQIVGTNFCVDSLAAIITYGKRG